MNTEKNSIIVQKYLGGEMTEVEQKNFEQELKSNLDLANELELYKKVQNAVKDNTLEVFKTKLNIIHRDILGETRRYHIFDYKAVKLLAASIVLVLTFGSILLFTLSNSNSTIDVFNEFYEPYEMSRTSRTALTSTTDSNLMTATTYYTNVDYKNAKLILEDLKSTEEDNSQVLIMLGISNMELNLLDEAKENFIDIISTNNPFYNQQAEWYLSLSYLKSDDKSNALLHLNAIVGDNGFYKAKAKEMISLLE